MLSFMPVHQPCSSLSLIFKNTSPGGVRVGWGWEVVVEECACELVRWMEEGVCVVERC